VVTFQGIDLRFTRKSLERAGHFDLQVHLRLGPGRRILNLLSNHYRPLAYDFIERLLLGGVHG